MSAFGGKADVIQGLAECPLIAKSGHKDESLRHFQNPFLYGTSFPPVAFREYRRVYSHFGVRRHLQGKAVDRATATRPLAA